MNGCDKSRIIFPHRRTETPDKQQVYRSLFVCLKACLSRSTHLNGVFSIIVASVDMICITLPLYPTMYVVSPLTYMKGH